MAPVSATKSKTRSAYAPVPVRFAIIALLLLSASLSTGGCGHKQLDPQDQNKADQMRSMHSKK